MSVFEVLAIVELVEIIRGPRQSESPRGGQWLRFLTQDVGTWRGRARRGRAVLCDKDRVLVTASSRGGV